MLFSALACFLNVRVCIEGREKTVSIETHAKWELLVAYKKAHVGAIFSPSHKMPFISRISCGYILCMCFPLQ